MAQPRPRPIRPWSQNAVQANLWDRSTIQQAFERHLASHPELYLEFRRVARQARRKQQRGSAHEILAYLRFRTLLSGRDVERYKVNNNYSSRLARMLIAEDPSFAGYFTLRALRSA